MLGKDVFQQWKGPEVCELSGIFSGSETNARIRVCDWGCVWNGGL